MLNDLYGSRSNYDLLEVYGFVLDDNKADVVSLELDRSTLVTLHGIV